ncbi:hypothetical protein HDU81_005078 [Chytriomyces hyalinus]|nr:hypothetical protein HDU81_005078 [Chytriomyces hyalinus]
MAYITSRLGLNFTRLKPGFLGDLGMREHRANDLINDGFVQVVCASADVIIISDTLPDARPLLQSLLRPNPAERCSSQIVVELTNRFDWGIADFDEYHQLIWQLHHAKPANLHWVANNAFEAKVMADDTLANPEFRIFRPSGFSDVPPNVVSPQEKQMALMRELDNSEVLATMRELQIPFNRVVGHYGGPHTLKQYRAYIEFPYQVSTMKLYENLAAGVVMLIPSHSFFKELVEKRIHAFGPWEMLRRMGPNWHEYMDYYVPELSPYIYYFNSFDHLREILTSTKDLDTKNVRVTAPAAYERITQDMLHGWADLFAEMGFPNLLVDGKKRGSSAAAAYTPIKKFSIPIRGPTPADLNEWKAAYGAVKAWKVKQRDEQIQIWDDNQKKLTPFELEMKEAAQSGSQYYEKKRKQEAHRSDLVQYQVLDYLHGELNKQHTFGGSLKGKSFDPADALESVLGLADKEVHMEFKPQDFETFGHLARYLHVAHHIVREPSLDSSISSKIPRLMQRASTLTDTLTKRLYPWIMNDKVSSINDMMGQWSGRGIAFTFPTSGYPRGVHLILALRNILNCTLPIEIFYIGENDLGRPEREKLAKLPMVTLINMEERLPKVRDVNGFNIKPYVMLASSFREVIFLDDDVTMIQNPATLVDESLIYKTHGTLFFLDRSFSAGNSEWARSFIPFPSSTSENGRYMRDVSRDEQESSLVVLDKGRLGIVHALLAACHMNLKQSRDEALHKYTHGDKESFWLSHELVRAPYGFIPGVGGAAGFFRTKNGNPPEPDVVCGPQSHIDEMRRLTHFNGLTLLHKDDPSKGYIDFHHYVAPIRDNPGNVDIGHHPWCVHSRVPSEEVIEMNEREKRVLGQTIELHKRLVLTGFDVASEVRDGLQSF